MNSKLLSVAAATAAFSLLPLAGHAQTSTGTDNASSSTYYNGSYSSYAGGQNGGTGFGAFNVAAAGNGGTFIYTANESEGGNGTPAPGTIDSPPVTTGGSPLSFGIYSSGGPTSSATVTRSFATSLANTGDMFSLDFVTGTVVGSTGVNGTSGVELLSGTTAVGSFFDVAQGGPGSFQFNGAPTSVNFAPGALHFVYDITSPTTYSFTATGAVSYTGTGTFSAPITGFEVQQTNAGGTTPEYNAYFNNLSVTNNAPVPEASSSVGLGLMLALGGLTLAARKRRVKA